MRPSKRQRLAGKAVYKCRSGEPITNPELRAGISVLQEVIPALMAMGDAYYLATADLNRRLAELESFHEARKRK